MTFKDIFPGLSRTKVISQELPGAGFCKKNSRTSQDFPGGMETLHMATASSNG